MITIHNTITNERGTLPTKWEDVTLDQAVKVAQVELKDTDNQLDWYEQVDAIEQIWSAFTAIDPAQLHPTELVYYFTTYLLGFVQDINGEWPRTYTPVGIESFKHKGETYLLPKSLVIDEQTVVLQHTQTARPFVEATNLLQQYNRVRKDGIKQMGMFVAAVVKREHGEKWDEAAVIERGKLFNDLTMDVVWEVFFCINQHIHKSINDTLQSMQGEITRLKVKRNRTKGLDGRLGYLRQRRAELQEELKALTK